MPVVQKCAHVLVPGASGRRAFAFHSLFGIKKTNTQEECQISYTQEGRASGCRVSRVDISIHCCEPHLETAGHVLLNDTDCSFEVALPQGTLERTILITPRICTLEQSGETYPIGENSDLVISAKALKNCLQPLLHLGNKMDSVIVRIPESKLQLASDTGEILSWPYLTIEAALFLNQNFLHYRTNVPSIEPADSKGGMWSHCLFFGIVEESRLPCSSDYRKRTIGELFYISTDISDGEYTLMCPYVDLGMDCALTTPMLYNQSS